MKDTTDSEMFLHGNLSEIGCRINRIDALYDWRIRDTAKWSGHFTSENNKHDTETMRAIVDAFNMAGMLLIRCTWDEVESRFDFLFEPHKTGIYSLVNA